MSLLDATQMFLDGYPDRGRPAFSSDIQIGQKMSVRLQVGAAVVLRSLSGLTPVGQSWEAGIYDLSNTDPILT